MNILWFLAGMLVMLGLVFLTLGFLTKLTIKTINEKKERVKMAKIKLSKGGFTPIPEGTHVFKITSESMTRTLV